MYLVFFKLISKLPSTFLVLLGPRSNCKVLHIFLMFLFIYCMPGKQTRVTQGQVWWLLLKMTIVNSSCIPTYNTWWLAGAWGLSQLRLLWSSNTSIIVVCGWFSMYIIFDSLLPFPFLYVLVPLVYSWWLQLTS